MYNHATPKTKINSTIVKLLKACSITSRLPQSSSSHLSPAGSSAISAAWEASDWVERVADMEALGVCTFASESQGKERGEKTVLKYINIK